VISQISIGAREIRNPGLELNITADSILEKVNMKEGLLKIREMRGSPNLREIVILFLYVIY
jgi:hypothetical protein